MDLLKNLKRYTTFWKTKKFFKRKGISSTDIGLVQNSKLFDAEFYARNYNIIPSNAAEHYCVRGWLEGNQPSVFFNPKFYCEQYPDVSAARTNPLLHYLRYGGAELRSPSPCFDPQLFSSYHPYAVSEHKTPAEICIQEYGDFDWLAKFNKASSISDNAAGFFSQFFDEDYYLSFNQDFDTCQISAYEHFLKYGQFEYRNPCASFDCYFVAKQLKAVHHPGRNVVMELYRRRELLHVLKRTKSVNLHHVPSIVSDRSANLRCNICIHVHCFYIEIFKEIATFLLDLDNVSHLVVTVTKSSDKVYVEQMLANRTNPCDLTVIIVENRGRDIAPFLLASRAIWKQYDVVLHLHTKLSSHVDWGRDWGKYLVWQTIGSRNLARKMHILFSQNKAVGCAYPENYYRIKPYIDADRSDKTMAHYATILEIDQEIVDANEFPAGAMAWYRTVALEKVLSAIAKNDMFDEEANQQDYTLAHSLERLIPMSVTASGFETVVYTTNVRGGFDLGLDHRLSSQES